VSSGTSTVSQWRIQRGSLGSDEPPPPYGPDVTEWLTKIHFTEIVHNLIWQHEHTEG